MTMTLSIPVGFAQCIVPLKHSALSRPAMVTFGADVSSLGGVDSGDCNAIGADFQTRWGAFLANEIVIGPVEMMVGQDGGENLAVTGDTTYAGSNSGEREHVASALLLHKRTARGGRRGRGRMYLPWVLAFDGIDENGSIKTAGLAGFQSAATAFLADLTANGAPMVLLHTTGPEETSPPGPPNAVVSMTVDKIVGTQRRRLGRS